MTFHIRRLGVGDLGHILDMQERVVSGLADKSIFQVGEPSFIEYCLGEGGRCYGVWYNGEPVAYRMVYFSRDREFNLAKDSSLPPSQYRHVAHWDTIAVLPPWHGFGLSKLMNTKALADLMNTDIRHLFATTSPYNPHGLRSLMEAGFRPVRLVQKFDGKLRFLCYRPYPVGWPGAAHSGAERTVALPAISALRSAFQDGWVGVGVSVAEPASRLRMRPQPLPIHVRHSGRTSTDEPGEV